MTFIGRVRWICFWAVWLKWIIRYVRVNWRERVACNCFFFYKKITDINFKIRLPLSLTSTTTPFDLNFKTQPLPSLTSATQGPIDPHIFTSFVRDFQYLFQNSSPNDSNNNLVKRKKILKTHNCNIIFSLGYYC